MHANSVLVLMGDRPFDHFLIDQLQSVGLKAYGLTHSDGTCLRVHSHCGQSESVCAIEVEPGISMKIQDISGVIVLDHSVINTIGKGNNDDRHDYKKSGWLAFWLHALYQAPFVINKIHHHMLSPSYFSLPRLYKMMKEFGLKTPNYEFNSRGVSAHAQRIFMQNLGCFADFSGRASERYFCVEKKQGVWILVLCCYNDIEAVVYDNGQVVSINSEIRNGITQLCRALAIDIAELLFLFQEGEWTVYGVTAWPNWPIWFSQWHSVAKAVIVQIKQASKKSKETQVNKTVPPLVLPHYRAK